MDRFEEGSVLLRTSNNYHHIFDKISWLRTYIYSGVPVGIISFGNWSLPFSQAAVLKCRVLSIASGFACCLRDHNLLHSPYSKSVSDNQKSAKPNIGPTFRDMAQLWEDWSIEYAKEPAWSIALVPIPRILRNKFEKVVQETFSLLEAIWLHFIWGEGLLLSFWSLKNHNTSDSTSPSSVVTYLSHFVHKYLECLAAWKKRVRFRAADMFGSFSICLHESIEEHPQMTVW